MDHVVDSVRGTPCAYVIELEGDAAQPFYIYVGTTTDVQTRLAQHAGGIPGGSKWTALHPPKRVLDVVPCNSAFHACCVEVALWGFWAGRLKDYNRVRGGKYCMCESLMYPPPGWRDVHVGSGSSARSSTRPPSSNTSDEVFPL